jgi:hypothetical protein
MKLPPPSVFDRVPRKAIVKVTYLKFGPESAHRVGVALGVNEQTLHTWFETWRRAA